MFNTFKKRSPSPRTRFENAGQENPRPQNDRQKAFEQAIASVLIHFPDAHRAVLAEMQRLDAERRPVQT
jgi:hypothetical protein